MEENAVQIDEIIVEQNNENPEIDSDENLETQNDMFDEQFDELGNVVDYNIVLLQLSNKFEQQRSKYAIKQPIEKVKKKKQNIVTHANPVLVHGISSKLN